MDISEKTTLALAGVAIALELYDSSNLEDLANKITTIAIHELFNTAVVCYAYMDEVGYDELYEKMVVAWKSSFIGMGAWSLFNNKTMVGPVRWAIAAEQVVSLARGTPQRSVWAAATSFVSGWYIGEWRALTRVAFF